MPWKECSVMDERVKFVARRLAGEPMADLCREFGISRKTGYKIFDRYQQCGIHGHTAAWQRQYDHIRPIGISHQVGGKHPSGLLAVLEQH